MLIRRHVLKLAALGLGAATLRAQGQVSSRPDAVPLASFSPAQVMAAARTLAKKPFAAPSADLPSPFNNLSFEQYGAIRVRPGSAAWAADQVGFAVEPLHRGFLFSAPMTINLVESGVAHRLAYDPSRFDLGGLTVPANLPDIGYSGFRVVQPDGSGGAREVAIFQGASFFRAVARGQTFGVTARALSIRTADPRGEEFPLIREVWIEKPSLAAGALVVHALVDSESVAGAYRFTLRPGDVTIVDTECTLFTRGAVDGLGLGTMAAMSYFSPVDRRGVDDVREGVYEVGGLQVLNGNGEWLWRPVSNRQTLQISSFSNANPRGFGVLQRERRFEGFEDVEQHWEVRPSLWIEPLNDWGEGSVVLVEIPSDAEVNTNVVCFWRPRQPLAAGAETAFAYRQSWCWSPLQRPPLATVTGTRAGRGSSGRRRRFLVTFAGEGFADAGALAGLKPALSSNLGAVSDVRTFPAPEAKTCRVLFDLDPGNETAVELRLVLEADGKPASETWLYRWTA